MKKEHLNGIIASASLLLIYFLIVGLVQDFPHAIDEFIKMWYLILPLVLGFGVQVYLFTYIKRKLREKSKTQLIACGTISTTSMIACCAHHLTDILPIIGLSAATLFLTKYQTQFILIGIISNLIGILMLLKQIKKHKLYEDNFLTRILFNLNLKKQTLPIIILLIIFVVACTKPQATPSNTQFQPKISEGEVTVELTPKIFENNIFTINYVLNTHSVDLSAINLRSQTTLYIENKKYNPINNPQLSGHHSSGELQFNLPQNPTKFKIIIENIQDIKQRIFEWP